MVLMWRHYNAFLVIILFLNVVGLQFVTQSLVPSATTCDREHTELWCCTLGYTELVWQKRLTTSGLWYNITNQSRRYIQENNQTLVMESVTKTFDETKYRCTARNESGYEISHTMDLVIKGQKGTRWYLASPKIYPLDPNFLKICLNFNLHILYCLLKDLYISCYH